MGIGPHPHESAHQKKDRDMAPLFDGKSDAELLAIFEPMMDNCLAGSSAIDHAQHVRDFTDRLAAIVTRENLEAQCASYQPQLGVFGRREFVCLFGVMPRLLLSGGSSSQNPMMNSSIRPILSFGTGA